MIWPGLDLAGPGIRIHLNSFGLKICDLPSAEVGTRRFEPLPNQLTNSSCFKVKGGGKQSFCIRMAGGVEYLTGRPAFNDPAVLHDHQIAGHGLDNPKIKGSK